MTPVTLTRTPGQTLYAFPAGFSLADWDTHRVLLDEGTGANTGKYTASLDESKSTLWYFFIGASQPSDWGQSKGYFDLSDAAIKGDFILTVTVTDDDTLAPIENAIVTLSRAGERTAQRTDANGVAVIAVDAATWTYAVRAAGYEGETGTVVVTGDAGVSVDMQTIVQQVIVGPDKSALIILCLDQNGDPEPNVDLDIRISQVPSGDINIAYKGTKQTATSGLDGYATLEAIKGAVYEYKRGKSDQWLRVTIGQGASTNVQSIIGAP